MKVYTGFSWLRKGPVAGYSQHDYETYSMRGGELLIRLNKFTSFPEFVSCDQLNVRNSEHLWHQNITKC